MSAFAFQSPYVNVLSVDGLNSEINQLWEYFSESLAVQDGVSVDGDDEVFVFCVDSYDVVKVPGVLGRHFSIANSTAKITCIRLERNARRFPLRFQGPEPLSWSIPT